MVERLIGVGDSDSEFFVNDLNVFSNNIRLVIPLINALNNFTFFIKDVEAKYVLVNRNLIVRCGLKDEREIIGKKSDEVYAENLGAGYSEQDFEVMRKKRRIVDQLELHSYRTGTLGWCLTTKIPIFSQPDLVIGVAGISVDIQDERLIRPTLNSKLSAVEGYISEHFNQEINIGYLADLADMSVSQLNRHFKNIFQMSPSQLIQKKRLELAIDLLYKDLSITDIAGRCGYTDHSAFSRKFKELTTMTPIQFKRNIS